MTREITSKQLKTFSDHFHGFDDMYVLIGGSATSLHMETSGLNARTTKDLDLNERKLKGEHVNSVDLKKHKNDIYRLTQLLVRNFLEITPEVVKKDVRDFVEMIEDDDKVLKQLKINDLTMNDVKETLLIVYCNEV